MNLKGYLYKLLKTPFAMTPQELFELALSYYNGTDNIPAYFKLESTKNKLSELLK